MDFVQENAEITGFMMERELMKRNPGLFERFQKAVFALPQILSSYRRIFPHYTDHSELHALNVIDFCNRIMGPEDLKRLNDDEIYCLLMGCYLHDVGMGIREEDLDGFLEEIRAAGHCAKLPEGDLPDVVRKLHHELSGRFIRKYAMLFDFPSEAHAFAVEEIARGHRKTDLFDPTEFPADLPVPGGNTLCVPYLAALVRLADEVDVATNRSPVLLRDHEIHVEVIQQKIDSLQEAVREVRVEPDAFTLRVHTDSEKVLKDVLELQETIQATLDYCRRVVSERTPFEISQTKVIMERI